MKKRIKVDTERQFDKHGKDISWIVGSAAADIQASLNHVNRDVDIFTVRYAADVYRLALRAEQYLKDKNVQESDRVDATVTFRPAGPEAKDCQYAAVSTTVTLSRTGSGWYVTGIERSYAEPGTAEHFLVTISDRAAATMINHTLAAFGRKPQSEE